MCRGLLASKMHETAKSIVTNLISLVETYGYVLNGLLYQQEVINTDLLLPFSGSNSHIKFLKLYTIYNVVVACQFSPVNTIIFLNQLKA